jgi:hypothetical protein
VSGLGAAVFAGVGEASASGDFAGALDSALLLWAESALGSGESGAEVAAAAPSWAATDTSAPTEEVPHPVTAAVQTTSAIAAIALGLVTRDRHDANGTYPACPNKIGNS